MSVEHRLMPAHAAAAEGARLSLLLDLSTLWETALPAEAAPPARRSRTPRTRMLVIAAIVLLIGAVVGIAFAVGGGKKKAAAPISTIPSTKATSTTTTATVPPAPAVSPVQATFDPNLRATFYTVNVREQGGGTPAYSWKLTPPTADPTCNAFSTVKPNEAVWHHSDTDGCNHTLMGPAGHLGTVTVTVKNAVWTCTASFFGTNTTSGPPAQRCTLI
jgi:hypothetical protein